MIHSGLKLSALILLVWSAEVLGETKLFKVEVECPDGWHACADGVCLKLVKKNLKFFDAQDYCTEELKADFHVPTNRLNDQCTTRYVKDNASPTSIVWLGATDQFAEGYWERKTKGSWNPICYTNWAPGEPGGGVGENCLCLYDIYGSSIYSKGWNDLACAHETYFVCSRKGIIKE